MNGIPFRYNRQLFCLLHFFPTLPLCHFFRRNVINSLENLRHFSSTPCWTYSTHSDSAWLISAIITNPLGVSDDIKSKSSALRDIFFALPFAKFTWWKKYLRAQETKWAQKSPHSVNDFSLNEIKERMRKKRTAHVAFETEMESTYVYSQPRKGIQRSTVKFVMQKKKKKKGKRMKFQR